MLGPGVNSLLAIAAQQKQQQQENFLNRSVPSEPANPTSPSVSFGNSSPPQAEKSDSGLADDALSDGETESLKIDESENPQAYVRESETIEEVQV